jgi:glycosyltransferase involved in cell wall biosynthesis
VSKRLLFVGVSSMKDHAGQYKLYFLADAFGRQGIPVTVLVPDLEENRAFFRDKPHVQTHFYPPSHTLADLWIKSRFVNQGTWSAIWGVGVGLRSFLVRGGSSKKTPIVKDFDEFPSMIGSFGWLRRSYLRWIERRLVAQAQGFTCASAFLEDAVRRQRPEIGERLLRLPVAISAAEHVVKPELVSRLRKESAGRPVLLYVGSVNRFYEDQLDEVIELARVLHRRGSPARLRLVGGGPDLDYFKAKAAAARVGETLEFVGHAPREDLASHMEAADVLVFPFAADAFNLSRCPTKAYNYAAANRPVVTNRTGEVARLFGEAALYYPECDVEALADLCDRALASRAGFNNGIPFATLTWEARAEQFRTWLAARNWLPGGS